MSFARPCLPALVAVTLLGPAASGQSLDTLNADLETAKKGFGQAQARAKETALKRFDQTIALVKRGNQKPAIKLALQKDWEEKKEEFNRTGTWPGDQDLISGGLEYGRLVARAYAPLTRAYDRLIEYHVKQGSKDAADKVLAEKLGVEAQLPGRSAFKSGVRYHGQHYHGTNSGEFHLNVGDVTDNVFEGNIHEAPAFPGHPVYEVKGTVDGLRVQFTITKVVRGNGKVRNYDGLLLGRNLVVGVTGANLKGKPINPETLVLGRVGK